MFSGTDKSYGEDELGCNMIESNWGVKFGTLVKWSGKTYQEVT